MGIIPYPAAAGQHALSRAAAPSCEGPPAVALRWWGADGHGHGGVGDEQALRALLLSAHGAERALEPKGGLGALFPFGRQWTRRG